MYIDMFPILVTPQLSCNMLSMEGALIDVQYEIPKLTYLEASLFWILGKFCLGHGST